jgi:DNA mismatch endonuclease (patch repair protein)
MQGNRSRDTGPEVALRKLLFAQGLRYRVAYKPISGERITVDIAFPGPRVIVLVDGCFWHGCPEHHRAPKTHSDYWDAKLARNRARDTRVTQVLEGAGWTVLRFWEHEPPDQVATQVAARIRSGAPENRTRPP